MACGLRRRLTAYAQLIACATAMCACGVTGAQRPADATVRSAPRQCAEDEPHPSYKRRTLRLGQREYKLLLGSCVSDVDAAAIVQAYFDNTVADRRASRIPPLRPFSDQHIYLIFTAGSWRSHPGEGFSNVEFAVSLDAPPGRFHMQFVSVKDGGVTLWADLEGVT